MGSKSRSPGTARRCTSSACASIPITRTLPKDWRACAKGAAAARKASQMNWRRPELRATWLAPERMSPTPTLSAAPVLRASWSNAATRATLRESAGNSLPLASRATCHTSGRGSSRQSAGNVRAEERPSWRTPAANSRFQARPVSHGSSWFARLPASDAGWTN